LNDFSIWHFHWSYHGGRPVSDRTCEVAIAEKNLVRIINQSIIKRLEEFDRFLVMRLSPSCWLRLTRPVNSDVCCVTFLECLPILIVPSIIQIRHQFHVFLHTHHNHLNNPKSLLG
jgi:hypothetical protein